MGASAELFAQRKERGSELFLSRMTLILGLLFFVICLVMSLM
jgi:protein translocase SecG subunit